MNVISFVFLQIAILVDYVNRLGTRGGRFGTLMNRVVHQNVRELDFGSFVLLKMAK